MKIVKACSVKGQIFEVGEEIAEELVTDFMKSNGYVETDETVELLIEDSAEVAVTVEDVDFTFVAETDEEVEAQEPLEVVEETVEEVVKPKRKPRSK